MDAHADTPRAPRTAEIARGPSDVSRRASPHARDDGGDARIPPSKAWCAASQPKSTISA
ncbi:hypothetical protein BTH_II1581 [Burkholderia thailandensis E264]|uniref:Uncharacterized protein n=1 Tax=Burkholderia thailandensis (strain ATCC 700388 / DSM 13276 / CCUG 48851 / CIP 106301 / E264) TaxID=271848 RepID=Q2T4X3_BURTA|nr:hypothetical protein BTH_II1581 [Burkholderia thailandensis E264]